MDNLRLFNQFKLGNSVFTGNYRIGRGEVEMSKIPAKAIEEIAISKMTGNLSNFFISNYQSAIKKEEGPNYINFKLQLLILKVEDFKSIVESTIQSMPEEAIQKLRMSK